MRSKQNYLHIIWQKLTNIEVLQKFKTLAVCKLLKIHCTKKKQKIQKISYYVARTSSMTIINSIDIVPRNWSFTNVFKMKNIIYD